MSLVRARVEINATDGGIQAGRLISADGRYGNFAKEVNEVPQYGSVRFLVCGVALIPVAISCPSDARNIDDMDKDVGRHLKCRPTHKQSNETVGQVAYLASSNVKEESFRSERPRSRQGQHHRHYLHLTPHMTN